MTGKGNSSPGNANLRIGTQAGHDEYHQSDSPRKYFPQHTSSISPTHDAVIAPFRRYVHPPVSFLRTPPLRPPPGVIPAQAGILTRVAFYKGHAVAVNYAGKSLKVRIILCLSCSLWCGSGRYVNQDARTLIKIPVLVQRQMDFCRFY